MNESPEPRRRRVWISPRGTWIVVLLIAAVTRFVDLGRQSPWVDEILSWQMADKFKLHLAPGLHPLTYWVQGLALMLSNTVWGLRLPSAVFGFLAVVVVTAWAMRRLGPFHALFVGLALALSPLAIFYSQDANHYGPLQLAGVLAVVSVDWFLEPARKRWVWFVLSAAFVFVARWFHPAANFAVAALAVLFVIWVLDHAAEMPPRRLAPRRKRLLFGLMFFAIGALAAHHALMDLLGRQGLSQPNERPVGLNWPFLSALLADFFGGLFHHGPSDILLGVSGLIVSTLGWWQAARHTRVRWAVAGAVLTAVFAILPFLIFHFSHYFAPRYVIEALPAFLMGVGILISEILLHRVRIPFRRTALALLWVWCALFLFRFGVWEVDRIRNDHQPTYQALDYFREHTPDNSILVTRHRYTSRALHFLWKRFHMGGREQVALSYLPALGAPSIQEAEELVRESGRPVYFLSLLESEEHLAPDFDRWLDQRTSRVVRFASGTPDDFAPIDWSITLRKVLPPDGDPFALPRNGNDPSGIVHEDRVNGRLVGGYPRIVFPPGTGASYRIRLPKGTEGIQIGFEQSGRGRGGAPSRWLVAGFQGGPTWLGRLDSSTPSAGVFIARGDLPSGVCRLDLFVTDGGAPESGHEGGLVIHTIRVADRDEEGDSIAMSPLHSLGKPTFGGETADPHPAGMTEQSMLDLELRMMPLRSPMGIDEASWKLEKQKYSGGPLVVVQRLWPRGLGDRAVGAEITTELGDPDGPDRFLAPLDWSYSTVMAAAVIPHPVSGDVIDRVLALYPYESLRPWLSQLSIDTPELYEAEKGK